MQGPQKRGSEVPQIGASWDDFASERPRFCLVMSCRVYRRFITHHHVQTRLIYV